MLYQESPRDSKGFFSMPTALPVFISQTLAWAVTKSDGLWLRLSPSPGRSSLLRFPPTGTGSFFFLLPKPVFLLPAPFHLCGRAWSVIMAAAGNLEVSEGFSLYLITNQSFNLLGTPCSEGSWRQVPLHPPQRTPEAGRLGKGTVLPA